MKMILTLLITLSSFAAMAAQQNHFACHTRGNSVITVQEDSAGTISLNRTESTEVDELNMIARTQKQILVADAGEASVTSTDNGNTKQISLKFHGSAGDSQVILKIKKVLFGKISLMSISGNGAALARVQNMISSSELGISFSGCRLEIE